jgi:uncharacterized membrane protein YsdA (DUF1294 family)
MITTMDRVLLGWILLSSLYALGLFGLDKLRAGETQKFRISEIHLLLASSVGGWLGALAGMLMFRHKTRKTTFKLKFGLAFLIWTGLLAAYWNRRAFFAAWP